MRDFFVNVVFAIACATSTAANAADIRRVMAAEIDPVAPTAAAAESNKNQSASMWGGTADFNLGEVATGPDFWMGTFNRKGPASQDERVRREDLQFGESHKVEAMRLRWSLSVFEKPTSLRGWYARVGYSYTKINSRANRDYNVSYLDASATSVESVITDTRHGCMIGFGQRWAFMDQKLTATLGISATQSLVRKVSDDSADPDARTDYESFIEDTPYAKMSSKPIPEASLMLGYLL